MGKVYCQSSLVKAELVTHVGKCDLQCGLVDMDLAMVLYSDETSTDVEEVQEAEAKSQAIPEEEEIVLETVVTEMKLDLEKLLEKVHDDGALEREALIWEPGSGQWRPGLESQLVRRPGTACEMLCWVLCAETSMATLLGMSPVGDWVTKRVRYYHCSAALGSSLCSLDESCR